MPKAGEKKNLSTHFLAGGGAGLCEAVCCHPLDTIKVRMQLSKKVSYQKNKKIPWIFNDPHLNRQFFFLTFSLSIKPP
ncbi:hypothetical protein RhiirA5_462107 [Rhizophagus irregularis]|uniref:Uncharacterized protein n=1 Tax=Rhizophagus irregularis TaxID=588596 RepID=A0A2N0NTK4_9GLOM|nr:hypothetical protein RhiirA5_301470 [Rhizophagus irregularis]PKB99324.1 hypothetical protein RhiirA5_462107 [Rhizophagus irregularis]